MPAVDCNVDHRTHWVDGGATTIENLTLADGRVGDWCGHQD